MIETSGVIEKEQGNGFYLVTLEKLKDINVYAELQVN